jgi:hypothetical protein
MQKAVTYVRVSSKEQHERGYSPDAQKRLLCDFERQNSFGVVEEFEDAETAKEAGRTAFSVMPTDNPDTKYKDAAFNAMNGMEGKITSDRVRLATLKLNDRFDFELLPQGEEERGLREKL